MERDRINKRIAEHQREMLENRDRLTPYTLAIEYLQARMENGASEEDIMDTDCHSGCLYYWVEQGPTCSSLRRGRMRVYVEGHDIEVFSINELMREIRATKGEKGQLAMF